MNKNFAQRLRLQIYFVLIMISGYLFPLLPPIFLKRALDSLTRGQAAWFSIIALLVASVLRIFIGYFSTFLLRWISDRESLQTSSQILRRNISHMTPSEMHSIFNSEIPKFSQKYANDTVFFGQCLSLLVIGAVMFKVSVPIFFLAYIPAVLVTIYMSQMSLRTRELHDAARSAQEKAKSIILASLRNSWNLQSDVVRLKALSSIRRDLKKRTQAVSTYRKELSRQSILNTLTLPIGTLVIVITNFAMTTPLGIPSLSLMLAYFGSASMLSRGVIAAFSERVLILSAGERISELLERCPTITNDVLNLRDESVFRFESVDAFFKFVAQNIDLSEELDVMGIASYKLEQLGTNGNGLSNGENKRLYTAIAIALSEKSLKIVGFKEMVSEDAYLHIRQRLALYCLNRRKMIELI